VKVVSVLDSLGLYFKAGRAWNIWFRVTGRYVPYLIFSLILLLLSTKSYSSVSNETSILKLTMSSANVLTGSSFPYILTLLSTLTVICSIIVFFSIKLKKVNRELKERNKQILNLNIDSQKTDSEKAIHKELSTKDHYESDKLNGMLLQAATDGISFYDKDWNLKYTNSAFYSMIGLDRDSYNSLDSRDLIHPEDRDFHLKRMQAFINEGFFESELRLRHKDGHYINLSTRSVPVRYDNGEVLGALTISRDITKLKQDHEDLIKANVEAEASSRLKSGFLANISHEIRTPLNSVVGFSNLLLANNITKEAREEYIEHINHNSEKLLQIIGDIIDLSRLESSQIEITYEETSLNAIVNEIIEDARQIIKRNEKSIILNVINQFEDNGDLIFTDRIWLKRVLYHLMDNAVKFTLDGSIEFLYLKENENIIFKIKDTGIGINKENLGHIFEEFRQEIDGHHRPFEGLGVGLTLAKEVVERMGGEIFVQSEKGLGSEFSFSIPYRPAGSTKTKIASLSNDQLLKPIDWSSRKCLLVDDNKDVLIYLNRILLDTGIIIITARSGFEALEIVKATPDIDVVLLDMQMPEMNGIEATKKIREIRKNLPIIAQTAFIFEDDKDIILEAGCDACLIKPIRKDHLLTVMSSFLKSN
jgi:PAS domain S-box-containing protein